MSIEKKLAERISNIRFGQPPDLPDMGYTNGDLRVARYFIGLLKNYAHVWDETDLQVTETFIIDLEKINPITY